MSNGKAMVRSLIFGLTKKTFYKMSQCFPKLYNHFGKFTANLNNIDTNGFVLNTKYDTDKSDLEKKINDADKTNT